MGHSGGGPHAMACAALVASRVAALVSVAGLAPFSALDLDWFTGMGPASTASLRAATMGRHAKEGHVAMGGQADPDFTRADWEVLEGEWGWFGSVVAPAIAAGPAALIDDDLAYVSPWGFDLEAVRAPALLVHGTADRVVPSSHSRWLADRLGSGQLRLHEGEGHISVLRHAEAMLEWICEVSGAV